MPTYRYIKWIITQRDNRFNDPPISSPRNFDAATNVNSIQVAEFRVTQGGSPVAWNGGVTCTGWGFNTSPGGEGPDKLVDGTTSKWLDFSFTPYAWASTAGGGDTGRSEITIDNIIGITFDGYQIQTAEDAKGRDPVSWEVYGSNDNSSFTLLDAKVAAYSTMPDAANTWTAVIGLSALVVNNLMVFRANNNGANRIQMQGVNSLIIRNV